MERLDEAPLLYSFDSYIVGEWSYGADVKRDKGISARRCAVRIPTSLTFPSGAGELEGTI